MENLRIIEEERLVDRVRDDIGPYFGNAWSALGDHDLVGEAVRIGLMGALQLTAGKKTRTRFEKPEAISIRNHALANASCCGRPPTAC